MENENERIKNIMGLALDKVKELASSDTIVGSPIHLPDGIIVPISKVTVGYALGGGEMRGQLKQKDPINFPVAVATGGGVSVTPIGFLIDSMGKIDFVPITSKVSDFEKVIEAFEKISKFLKSREKEKNEKS